MTPETMDKKTPMHSGQPVTDFNGRFTAFAREECGMHPSHRYLVAVSGGLDSVALCDLLRRQGYAFVIAHCNFGLRGGESERDEHFVTELAASLQTVAHVKRFDTAAYASEKRISIQEAARELRYGWFGSLMEEDRRSPEVEGGRRQPLRLLTAHHLDDSIETLLINLCKGTGIAGLRGMLPDSGKALRPLLFATRDEIREYAEAVGLSWVEDSSNREVKYTRNRVRLELLPTMEGIFPQARRGLAESLRFFRDAEVLQMLSVDRLIGSLCERREGSVHIPVEKLRKTPGLRTVLFHILRDLDFTPQQTDEVASLMDASTGRFVLSPTHRALRNRAWIVVSPLREEEEQTAVIESAPAECTTVSGTLRVEETQSRLEDLSDDGGLVAHLDARDIRFPLLLRRWRKGDYFHPLGMRKKKKVARFLIDRKLSLSEKERVWVVESDRRILWVVGMRPDDRFKLTPSTSKSLRMTWTPARS